MKCADLSRRLFQVLPTASARRERPVTSTPPGGSALLVVSLLALKVIATGSNNWYDHTDWAGAQLLPGPTPGLSSPTAPPSSDSLPSPISRTNYQLVWSDEFNGTSVDASKWNKVGPWGHPFARRGAAISPIHPCLGTCRMFRRPTARLRSRSIILEAVPAGLGLEESLARTRPSSFGTDTLKRVSSFQ